MLSIGKLAAGGEGYYLHAVAGGFEDYYLGSGEAPGTWLGSAAADLELSGVVVAEHLRAVLAARDPASGQVLRSGYGARVPGFDVTLSAPKSVSVVYGLGEPKTSGQVRQAHDEAVRQAIGYLEQHAAKSRRGTGGTETVEVTGLIAAAFRHRTSRAGDPALHTHVVVANLVRALDDGKWRTLDATRLYAHARTAGFVYQAALRDQLTRRLGLAWQPVRRGAADLTGVPAPVIEHFSQRRVEILDTLTRWGTTSAAAAQTATLVTRKAKDYDVRAETLQERWRTRGERLGFAAREIASLLHRERRVGLDGVNVDQVLRRLAGPDGLTANTSTFTRRDVVRAWAEHLPRGGNAELVAQLTDASLNDRSELAVRLLPRDHGADGTATVDQTLQLVAAATGEDVGGCQPLRDAVHALLAHTPLQPAQVADRLVTTTLAGARDPIAVLTWRARREAIRLGVPLDTAPLTRPEIIRRHDGQLLPADRGEARYSTPELLLLEQRTLDQARAMSSLCAPGVPTHDHLATSRLSPQQAAMVQRLTQQPTGLAVIVGEPGAGKTTALRAAHTLWTQSGHRVIGAALAARAAQELQTGAGIPSGTLDRLLVDLPRGGLSAGDIVVVDEASLVGTRKLAELLGHTHATGARVVLVGDPRQLPEVAAGGLFRALTDQLPIIELSGNHRQRHALDREALAALRSGDHPTAIKALQRSGTLVSDASPAGLREQLVDEWWQARESGQPGLMLAPTLADVEDLNRRARHRLGRAGQLDGPTLWSASDTPFQTGDQVLFTRNDRRLGVLNGMTGRVTGTDPTAHTLTVAAQAGVVAVPAAYLDRGDLRHGYATSVHKAQGRTVERTWALLTDATYEELAYVALSRHRDTARAFLSTAPGSLEADRDAIGHPTALAEPGTPAPDAALAEWLSRSRAQQPAIHQGVPTARPDGLDLAI